MTASNKKSLKETILSIQNFIEKTRPREKFKEPTIYWIPVGPFMIRLDSKHYKEWLLSRREE